MKKMLLTLSFLFSFPAYAEFRLLEVDKVYLDFAHYTWAIEPFLANEGFTPTNRIDLHVDLEFLNSILFLQNMIHSETDTTQYRLVGWQYRFGVHIWQYADVFFEHYSQHILDAPTSTANTYDSLGVRIYFYRKDYK